MLSRIIKKISVTILILLVGLFGLYGFSKVNLLKGETALKVDVDKYVRAEMKGSKLTSRKWMSYGMEIAKHQNFAPASASRFYAYIASVYADVLSVSNEGEASLATAQIINILVPSEKDSSNQTLLSITPTKNLSVESQKVLDRYKKRILDDKYDLAWDKVTPEDKTKWFVRNDKIDKGAKAGEWSTWLLSGNETLNTPTPPVFGSLKDKLEVEKVRYAVVNRQLEETNTIYFWHGSTGFEKGANMDNVTPAGVWQNILYIEVFPSKTKQVTDADYAYAQKILAQSIADAFIECWKVKYQYWSQRPSMRIEELDTLVADPPFPSYVSGHSTISATAATVLTALFPEKKQVWVDNMIDARNSRIMAGIHFDVDNKMGQYLGEQVGSIIVNKITEQKETPKVSKNLKSSDNPVINTWKLLVFKFQPMVRKVVAKSSKTYHTYFDKPIFKNVITETGIEPSSPSTGTSFADFDNDGDLDLFVAGRNDGTHLYRNDKGKFVDVTYQSGLRNEFNALVFSGIFGDYDNDGCLDLFMTGDVSYPKKTSNTWLYHSKCDGTFENVTSKSEIYNPYHGRGSNWVDYDSDGDLDIYVANQGDYDGTDIYTFEPNILFRNNGNGTFANVTDKAGVNGFIGDVCGSWRYRIKVNGLGFKASLQPIWFDFNNDNKIDLFIATDSGISVLYRNDGNGTFTNVTSEVGMCKQGTGMGVTVGDYDNDGDFDIYVTNVGSNYLWENQGNSTFKENSKMVGISDRTSLGWGTGFFDYDNDGHLDLYVVNGDVISGNTTPQIGKVRIDKLYHNLGNRTFESIAEKEGITGNDPKEGAAFGDYDSNGFTDLFVITGRKEKESIFRLYKNLGNKNHWVTLKLTGTKSNKDAVGAKITLISGDLTQSSQVISGSSFLSQNSLWQTFGLGKNKKIDEIKIVWPSGTIQVLKDIMVDQKVEIVEL